MGPRHSFWGALGPAEPPKFGTGPHVARGGVNPARSKNGKNEARAKGVFLFDILGEATRLGNRGVAMFAPIREHCELSGIEVMTLIAIAHAHSPPTVPQVGRSLGHPRQVIQRAVRVLQQRGLVEPLPNPGHKRASLLAATEAGRVLGEQVDAQSLDIVTGIADDLPLDAATLGAVADALQVLRRRIDECMAAGND